MKVTRMKILSALLLIVLFTTSCATGVVPMDKGEFMSSKSSAAGAFGDPQAVLADLYKEANEYCAKTGQSVETISAMSEKGIPFVRPARATLKFRCVNK
jgi:hypothetical protein